MRVGGWRLGAGRGNETGRCRKNRSRVPACGQRFWVRAVGGSSAPERSGGFPACSKRVDRVGYSVSLRALVKRYGLHKQPLFLAKYSRADTAPSFLRVAKALLEADGCKVLGKDFEAVFRVKYSVKRRFHIVLPVVRVLHLFGASFGVRALCHVNSLPLVSQPSLFCT